VPFSLHEQALYALMAVDEKTTRRLLSALATIESNPGAYTHAAGWDEVGRPYNICYVENFRIHFDIQRDGMVFIRDIHSR
jgi:hypothetical protein